LLAPDNGGRNDKVERKERKTSRAMRWIANIIGVILTLFGIFWILQGTHIVPVGVMAGQRQWIVIGSVVVIAGLGLLIYVNR
jgi:uncharacterized integral membrane protein